MRSYPNLIPLSQKQVYAIGAALAPLEFASIYGHLFDRVIAGGGKTSWRGPSSAMPMRSTAPTT
jgi:hypothetical protein